MRQSPASATRPSSSLELPVTALPGIGEDSAKLLERIGQYVTAGADQLNISLRAPFDLDLLERFSAALKLAAERSLAAAARRSGPCGR